MQDTKTDSIARLRQLLRQQRWASLATLDPQGEIEGAMVAFVMDEGCQRGYLHLSQLASHTRNLLRQPQAALTLSEPDLGEGDPQQLARVALQITVHPIPPEHPNYPQARARYLAALPDAEPRFDFADFHLLGFEWHKARLVGGFGQAFSYRPADLVGGAQKLAEVEKK